MRFSEPPAPIDVDDDAVRDALTHARVIPLLAAVAYATGDLSVLRDDLRPDPSRLLEPDGGVDGDRLALARQLAFDALVRFRDAGSVHQPSPSDEAMRRILAFVVGDHMVEDYLPLFLEELSVHGDDLRAPDWSLGELGPDTPFRVAVIGAGPCGLTTAQDLAERVSGTLVDAKNLAGSLGTVDAHLRVVDECQDGGGQLVARLFGKFVQFLLPAGLTLLR